MIRKAIVVALFLLTGGCVLPAEKYVAADRQTFDVIGPKFLQYVSKDDKLGKKEQDNWQALVLSWEDRIKSAEKK